MRVDGWDISGCLFYLSASGADEAFLRESIRMLVQSTKIDPEPLDLHLYSVRRRLPFSIDLYYLPLAIAVGGGVMRPGHVLVVSLNCPQRACY